MEPIFSHVAEELTVAALLRYVGKGRGPERGKQSDTEHYGYWGTRCLMVEWDGFINRSHQRSPLFMQIEQHAAQTIPANAFGQMQNAARQRAV